MARKRRKKDEAPGMNMVPAMGLILILIPLLVTGMESVKIAVVNVATPQIGPASTQENPEDNPDEKPLKLTVALTDRGMTIFVRGQVIENEKDPMGPTIPKIDGEEDEQKAKVYNYAKLKEMLVDLKKKHQTEQNIIISAEPNVEYRYIIDVMDVSRKYEADGTKKKMFPNVVLSAGVA